MKTNTLLLNALMFALLRWSHDQEVNLVVLVSVAGGQLITLKRLSLLHIYYAFITHLLHMGKHLVKYILEMPSSGPGWNCSL